MNRHTSKMVTLSSYIKFLFEMKSLIKLLIILGCGANVYASDKNTQKQNSAAPAETSHWGRLVGEWKITELKDHNIREGRNVGFVPETEAQILKRWHMH